MLTMQSGLRASSSVADFRHKEIDFASSRNTWRSQSQAGLASTAVSTFSPTQSTERFYTESKDYENHVNRMYNNESANTCKWCLLKGKKQHNWPEDEFGNIKYPKY